jgi:hypothetical protein
MKPPKSFRERACRADPRITVCGSDARRIPSRYTRRLADLPCFGRAVRRHVTVRRDRWCDYIQAAAEADPDARQVADRWHLLKNRREAIERLLERQSAVIGEAIQAAETPAQPACSPVETVTAEAEPTAEPSPPVPPSESCARTLASAIDRAGFSRDRTAACVEMSPSGSTRPGRRMGAGTRLRLRFHRHRRPSSCPGSGSSAGETEARRAGAAGCDPRRE